jgi:PKD repeat protein/subtilisin family serine protease
MSASHHRAAALLTALLFLAAPMALLMPAAAQPAPAPPGSLDWTQDWLAFHDRNGNKVDDAAEMAAARALADGDASGVGVLVTFGHAPGAADREALVAAGADPRQMYTFTAIPTVNTVVAAAHVAALGTVDGVVAVEWDAPLVAHLDISSPATQAIEYGGTGPNALYNGRTAQALGYTGQGMVVAVADTGTNELHEAFAGKFVVSADATAVAPPTCAVTMDEALHGTHVASTALGNPAGKPHKGTAIHARLVEIKVGSAVSVGGTTRAMQFTIDYNRAIAAGAPLCGVDPQDRIDVFTLSFGSQGRGGPNAGTAEGLITTLTQEGVAVTISAGNCGPSPSSTCNFGDKENGIGSPANAAGALAIANSNDRDTVRRSDDTLSTSSSRGPNAAGTTAANPGAAGGATSAANLADRHRKPDLAGPGTNIVAANSATLDGYVSLSGTSMSTPHIAGIAALLLQAGEDAKAQTGGVNRMRPTGTGFNAAGAYLPGVHPVRDALIHSAEYKTSGVPADMLAKWAGPGAGGLTWNNGFGYGHVNTFAAICWAWSNVLIPAGATAPAQVAALCGTSAPLDAAHGGPYRGFLGNAINLAASAEGGTPPYSFAWDLDNDGAYDDATGALASHVFPALGVHPIAVRVTDAAATTAVGTTTATISPLTPLTQVRSWSFDSDGCVDRQGWWDSVGADTVRLLVPGSPFHLNPVSPASAPCAWANGVLGQQYTPQSARNLWGPCMTLPPGVAGGLLEFRLAGSAEVTFDFLYARVNKGCLVDTTGAGVAQGTSAPLVVGSFTGAYGDVAASPPQYQDIRLTIDPAVVGGGPIQLGFRFESDILFEEQGYWIDDIRLSLRDARPTLAVASGSAEADEGALLALSVVGDDADGDPVTLRAEGLPAGAAFDPGSGALTWIPGHGDIGTHRVTFVASDGLLEQTLEVDLVVHNLAPTAAGSASASSTDRLTAVAFTDASLDANGGRIVGWAWAFGDGATSTAANPRHTYASLGTFQPTLTVTDEHGATDAVTLPGIEVLNIAPAAAAGGANAQANRVEPVQFTDLSVDRDGSIVAWAWAFGDGATSTAQHPSHQYTALGTYTATLTVTDSDGATASTSVPITVVNLLPDASFEVDPRNPTVLMPTRFDATATDADGSVASYHWAFGDGATSTSEDPIHVYLNGGTYQVTLTVTDNDGGVTVRSQSVFVCAPGLDVSTLLELERVRIEYEACLRLNEGSLPL